MSDFTYPGVYIKEIPSGPGPITGVTTSNLGLIGFTSRGPVDYPTLVTSFTELSTKFGSFITDGLLPTMAYAFFQNGGQRLYVVRVTHADAEEALWDYELAETAESLSLVAQASGLYELQIDHLPITPGSVTITFANAAASTKVNVFKDDVTEGTLTFNAAASGGAAGGGMGSIDYDSGEITIQLTVPGDFTGTPNAVSAAYTYRVLRFQMKWPGAVGNFFRVVIAPGSDDYMTAITASWSRFTVSVQEDLNQDPADRSWSTLETFSDLVFDDTTSKNYVVTVMNDAISGSQYVTVTDYGNAINPPVLAGTLHADENFYALQVHSDGSSVVTPDPYDGAWKGWKYQLLYDVFPTTLEMDFQFVEIDTRIGTATTPANAVANVTSPGVPLESASLTIDVNITGVGASTLTTNAGGDILHGATVVGSIDWATGAISSVAGDDTLSFVAAAHTLVAGTAITMSCTYATAVKVVDDGNGALAVDTTVVGYPTKFELNSAGTNTVDYDTGEVVITWKIAGDPAAGPDGVSSVATAATKDGGIEPFAMTSGDTFDLHVDGNPVAGTVTFTGTRAIHLGADPTWPIVAPTGAHTMTVVIDGNSYVVTAAGTETTELEYLNLINMAITGGAAYNNGGAIDIRSDSAGTGSSVQIIAGATDLSTHIGLTIGTTTGTGNVVDISAVTSAEVETLIEAASTAEVTVNTDGSFTVVSPTTGAASELLFDASGALAKLGITAPLDVFGSAALVGGELATYYDDPNSSIAGVLTGGLDGSATDSDDIVSPLLVADMRALYAFGKVDELMQLVAADFQTDTYVTDALLTYAELMKDKFVICAVPHGLEYQAATTWKRFTLNRYSSFGAIYYPHIKIKDPSTSVNVDVPPGGHIAGVYARTDANKNVGKCPAGMEDGVLAWSVGLEYDLTPTQVGVLTEQKINCLVQWPYTGRCVWGGRSLDLAGGEWPYLQMRRLFMFVEKSVFKATHVHVFKNNGPQLWNEISTQLTNFLSGLYQAGYFAGSTADDAFFVICNRSNNPQNTVDRGIVYCDIGIACNKPAEYICFRFSQRSLA